MTTLAGVWANLDIGRIVEQTITGFYPYGAMLVTGQYDISPLFGFKSADGSEAAAGSS